MPQGEWTGGVALSLQLLLYLLRRIRIGSLDVSLPNGATRVFRGGVPGPHGTLQIRSPEIVSHVLRGGEVGLGDAYLAGCWDSPDLTSLLMVLYLNEPHISGPTELNIFGRIYGYWRHRLRDNTRRGAKANIEHHYDLGNDFYQLWLDETMAYSSAVFEHEGQSLEDAQRHKFARMAERLRLTPEHRLLEIGSGWGGFAIYAAQHHGCQVHSITLSREQLHEAQRRAQQAGVADRIHFELRDYRDVAGQYDAVVSIEMYEAVGERYWPTYFDAIQRALKPGARAAIQGITINETIFAQYRTKRDFIQKYIFPGGMLCPPGRFQALAAESGLRSSDARFHAFDYAETLARWHRRVLDVRTQIEGQFDERFLRMWRYYLSYCECGFRTGSIDLMQITLVKSE
jgi:cyclopropane-fatty-acyl-phospholipid synthase